MNQDERDILIEVRTKVSNLTERIESVATKFDNFGNSFMELSNKVAVHDTKIDENSGFRKWVYGAVATSVASVITSGIIAIFKL